MEIKEKVDLSGFVRKWRFIAVLAFNASNKYQRDLTVLAFAKVYIERQST